MKTRKIMMKAIRTMEDESLRYDLKMDLMRKASKRFAERGESFKVNVLQALINNEQRQKTYHAGILTGYRLALTLMK